MGIDIHAYIERYNKKYNRWESLSLYKKCEDGKFKQLEFYNYRDYILFYVLAGVRGVIGLDTTISPLRGLPDDLSDEVKKEYEEYKEIYYCETWYDYCELINYRNGYDEALSYEDGELNFDDRVNKEPVLLSLTNFIKCIDDVLDAYDIWLPNPGEIRIILWFDC